MKHYDDRINELCDFKERLLAKKSVHGLNKNVADIGDMKHQKSNRRLLVKNESKGASMVKYNLSSSS